MSPPGFVEFGFFFLLLTGRNSLLKVLPLSEGFPHEAGVWARRAKYWSRNGVLRDEHKPRPRRLSSFLSSRLYYDPWNRDGGRLKHKLYAKNNLKATQYSLMTRFNINTLLSFFATQIRLFNKSLRVMKDMAKNLFLFFHLFVWLLYFFPIKFCSI